MKAASKRQSFYKVILPATGAIYCLSNAYSTMPAVAQSIIAAPDGTATLVTPNGDRIDISGGTLSGNGGNLFHSFGQFALKEGEIANFLSNPAIQNILARVVNGHPCIINGLIQVTGGNSNLFLANPAGIVFGAGARLNVPAAFTATTANGIGIGTGWFNASGNNNYAALVGTPSAFAFTMNQPGAIINSGDLAVKEGQSLVLLGGTVVNSGKLSAPGGQLLVSAMPGESVLRISQPGHLLSLEVEKPNSWTLPILSLPQLLTGGGATNANTLQTNSDGTVQLIGSGIKVEAGDAVIVNGSSHAGTATITAVRNLALVESQVSTTGDMNLIAANAVQIRDSVAQPFSAASGGNLYIQGNQAIDILALNHLDKGTPFQSGGAMTFVSNGNISGDSHFASVGPFSMLNLAGGPGNFISWYDPIISSESDVSLGDYTGASLKIETKGSITAGNITITTPDTTLSGTDPDIAILTSSPALILRAGVAELKNPVSIPIVNAGGTDIKTLTYNATNLGVLDGTTNSKATSINDSGQVVGASYNTNLDRRAFLYSDGKPLAPIGTLDGDTYSQATAINSSGQIAGYSGGKVERAFLYSGGKMDNLGTLVGGPGGYSQGYGLNTSGQVVGESTNAGPNSPRAFIYSGGTMQDLGALPGGTYSRAYGINDSGQVVGRSSSAGGDRAYIYSNGTMQDLGALAGGSFSFAYAINKSGQAAGISGSTGGDRAVLYSNGTITNLGVLPGDVKSGASGINNFGDVVGESRDASGNPGRAFLYTNGTMTDLNLLINPGSGLDKFVNAQVINDKGQIAGSATIGGQFRAFLADRVTTPGGGITVGNISTAGGPVILQAPKINVTGSSIASKGGAITIDGPMLLNSTTGAVNVNSGGGSIAFNQSVNGAQILSVDAGTGNIDFKGAVGNTAALASLSINSGKEINVGSINATGAVGIKVSGNIQIQKGDLTSNGLSLSSSGGEINLPGNIFSFGGPLLFQGTKINITSSSIASNGGAITFDGATQLASSTGAVNINSGDGDITFKSTLDGNQYLTLSSGKGNITFNGAVGSINPLKDFSVSQSKDFFARTFNTTGKVGVTASGNIQVGDISSNGLSFVSSGGEIKLPGNIYSLGGPLLFQGTKINIRSSSIVSNGGAIAFDGPTFLNSSTGAVNISSGNGDIAFKNTLDGNQDLTLSAGIGNIAFQGVVGSTNALDNLTVSSAKDVSAADITTTEKVEITDSGNINTGNISASLGISLTSTDGNINTVNLNSISGADSAIALSSQKGSVSSGDITSTGKVEIKDSGNINTGNIAASLGISLTSTEGNINTINLKSSSNQDSAIALSSQKGTVTGDINSAGKVQITDSGNINTGNISAKGGINVTSTDGNINTRNLNSSSSHGSGGAIALSSEKGSVSSGNITSTGNLSGGDINVVGTHGITAGQIDSSQTTVTPADSEGKAGNVTLKSDKNIVVNYINAQGGSVGTGGKVDITTATFFQANSTLKDQNGVEASITTAGGKEGGEIFIRHGGNGTTPFQVQMSDRSTTPPNGTVGAITSGKERKISNKSFEHSYTLGNIHIITESTPPPNGTLPSSARPIVETTPQPLPTVPIRLSDGPILEVEENPSVSDRNPEPEQPYSPTDDNPPISVNVPRVEQWQLPSDSSKSPILPDTASDSLVAAMEEPFTRQFEQHSGKTSSTRIATLATVQSSLSRIQTVTQIKPAIVYIVFAPATTASRSASKTLIRSSAPKTVSSMFGEEASLSELNQNAIAQSTIQVKRPNRDNENLELVIVTSSGKPIRKQLLVTRQEVLKVANQLRSEITKISRKDNYLTSSQQLYKWLITPIEADLNSLNIQNLVFVMDSGLRSLPIAALHDGQKFLVEKYSVGLMPSLSLTDTTYVDIKKAAVLAMGASVFPAAQRQKPLPAVPIELATITSELRQNKFFLNEAFTLENLKAQRQQKPAQIVHLATHGEFNSGAIGQSYIQLWDTKLRLDQIRQLGLQNPAVELLVLSACRSALGNEEAELGFAGLAVQAGVKSAIASLWYVSDEGTFGLMTDFYQKLQTAPIKAEALRQAQVAMLKGEVRLQKGYLVTPSGNVPLSPELAKLGNKDLSHPYYWAAFTMIGNPW